MITLNKRLQLLGAVFENRNPKSENSLARRRGVKGAMNALYFAAYELCGPCAKTQNPELRTGKL